MMRSVALLFVLAFAATLPAQEQLPTDPNEPMDIEPPLLIQEAPNRNIIYTTPGTPDSKLLPDPDQIAAALEKAKKSAACGERLYKSGIIAKVDAENRVLKVIRLEADLAQAKLELANQNVAAQQARLEAGEISEAEIETAKSLALSAMKEAESATAEKENAELGGGK